MSGRVLNTSLRSINFSHSISSARLKFRPSAFMWEVSIFFISIFKKQRKTDNRIFYPFLSIFDHVTSQVSGTRSQERYFIFTFTFLGFSCCFSSKKLSFYHFHLFCDEVSNIRNMILTNHKLE